MKERSNEGWVLQVSILAVFQWHVVQSASNQVVTNPLSPTYLHKLANQEWKIYNAMKVYREELLERLELVKKYIRDYESSTVAGTFHLGSEDERDKMLVKHPILAFRMLSRFANEFDALDRHISAGAEKEVSEVVFEAKDYYGSFPNTSDFEEAVSALLRMQFIYALPLDQIANGQIPGGKSIPVKLTTEQCYFIAKNAQSEHYYTLALEWFDETKQRIKNDPQQKNNLGITESSLDNDILAVITEHNNMYDDKFEDRNEYLYSEIVRSVVGPRPSTMRQDVVSRFSTAAANKSHPNYREIMYARNIALCNCQNIRPSKDESNLKCFLDRGMNPYWSILPLKIELLNDSPQIIQIHDFISDSWISELKKAAYADLREIRPGATDAMFTAGYSWHEDEELTVPLSRKIELATGLNVRGPGASPGLEVAAYAFGGYLEVHVDSNQVEDQKVDSVFSFLIYLNDVDIGGSTTFPKLGFFVKPEKGSAIFWNTKTLDDGTQEQRMLHGSCPMIYGEKWIATKFIYSIENMFTRPCGLKEYMNE